MSKRRFFFFLKKHAHRGYCRNSALEVLQRGRYRPRGKGEEGRRWYSSLLQAPHGLLFCPGGLLVYVGPGPFPKSTVFKCLNSKLCLLSFSCQRCPREEEDSNTSRERGGKRHRSRINDDVRTGALVSAPANSSELQHKFGDHLVLNAYRVYHFLKCFMKFKIPSKCKSGSHLEDQQ